MPATVLPRPAPITSRLGLWRWPVSASADMALSRLLTVPMSANATAGCSASAIEPVENSIDQNSGRVLSTTGASSSRAAPMMVPTISAPAVEGTNLLSRRGQVPHTMRVMTARPKALRFMSPKASGQDPTESCGRPSWKSAPGMAGLGARR